MSEPPKHDVDLFTAALALPPAQRAAFLAEACGGDAELRRRVEALLLAHDSIGDFLEVSPQTDGLPGRERRSAGEKPGDRIGHYKLLQQIGEGGCGVVFMAEQSGAVRRRVALKIIKPGMDTKSVIARFEAERQALALMDHPNIAKIFDAGATESGRPYFVMELVRGIKITDYCDQRALTTQARLTLFVQVCHAVQHAHQKGIIHRDIKPSNILVTETEQGETLPVVIDFGIAKATTNQQLTDKTLFTAFEMLIGTPAYMSPEQAALTSVDVDTRTDVYSLGVLLYELLTGSTPFDTGELLKAGLDEIRRVIREQEPVRPSTRLSKLAAADLTTVAQSRHSEPPVLIRTIHGDLDWIVMKALEKDRTRRYPTAHGLSLDVVRFLTNEAVSARPPSKLYRLRKVAQRNKLLFTTVTIIALLTLSSLVAVSTTLARERRARLASEAASIKSREVTKFLEDMLKGVGPSVARGRNTEMLQEILDETAAHVGKVMTNQPEVEAELCGLIAHLYAEMGAAAKGEGLARNALAIRIKLFGANTLAVAESQDLLGMILGMQHEYPEAERAHREALTIRQRLLGEGDPATASSLNALAEVYRDQHKLSEAQAMANEALQLRRRLFGHESLEVANSLRNVCLIQGLGGQWTDAEQTAHEILNIRKKLLGEQDPSVASAMEDWAWALNALNRFEEAQKLDTQALIIRRKYLGDSHPDVPRNLSALGQLLGNRGDLESADAVLKAVLSIQRKLLGDDKPATLETFSSLARVLQREGKHSEAEALWREVLAIGEHGPWSKDHLERLYALRGLADSLESQAKWAEAEALWRESLSLWRERGGIEERQAMYTLRRLGLALEGARNWPAAESVYREALTIARAKGNENEEALVDLDRMVRALLVQKKFDEAQQLLDGMLTPAFVVKPASANLLTLRVNLMARRGRWQSAAADVAALIDLQPTDHYHYHRLVGLAGMMRDRPAYERVCKALVTKFADSTDPFVAERIAQDCLLWPNSAVDLALMDKLADKALSAGSGTDGLPYFQVCKAMVHYRLGHFPEAIAWAEKTSAGLAVEPQAKAKALAIAAMAHWQSGRKEAARAALADGNLLVPDIPPGQINLDLGESWVASLMARITLNEADALIRSEAALGNPNPAAPQ